MTGLRATWRRWSISPRVIRFTRARITLQWWLAGKPVPAPHVVKQRTVIAYQKRYRLRTFIETGTYTGEMVQAMIGDVDRIVTIEVAPSLHARAVIRFASQPRIRVLLGDSAALLPVVLASLDRPALFWLDGHYMGGESGRGTEDTPVIAEMSALLEHAVRGHVVLIDDATLRLEQALHARASQHLVYASKLTRVRPREQVVEGQHRVRLAATEVGLKRYHGVAALPRDTLHAAHEETLGHTNIKMTSTYLNATTQGVKQAFKKLEAKRRRQGLKVVRGPQVARG